MPGAALLGGGLVMAAVGGALAMSWTGAGLAHASQVRDLGSVRCGDSWCTQCEVRFETATGAVVTARDPVPHGCPEDPWVTYDPDDPTDVTIVADPEVPEALRRIAWGACGVGVVAATFGAGLLVWGRRG